MVRLNGYLHRIGTAESGQCECGQARETVKHFLFRCTRWEAYRAQMLAQTEARRGNLSFYLGGKAPSDPDKWTPNMDAVRTTIKFAIATGRLEMKSRNASTYNAKPEHYERIQRALLCQSFRTPSEKMASNTDLQSSLLENFEFVSNLTAGGNDHVGIELCWCYAMLKVERFQRCGRVEDLEEAIEKGRWAVQRTGDESKKLTGRLNDLGIMLESRYERMGKMEDLEEAIRLAQKAVDITPKDHPDLAGWLTSLGIKLGRRYERMGKIEDVEEATLVA
ncbi:hypothetical protein B0J14DRAFT_676400 [Halenospora varia]|nr:hypothetical protein B0J14DRAFT_676400 [Halenospora varia]